jgi:hypothetical protein
VSFSAGRRRSLSALAGAAVLISAALGLQALRERWYPRGDGAARDVIYVTSAAAVGRAVLSFDALAADIYWIRAIQYYGGTRLSKTADKQYPLLRPLLELTTSLDPRFTVAYRFGAIFLAESPPEGPGRPDWSLALLQKGMAAAPGQWQLAMDTGFVYYWWLRDYRNAAVWFERAAGMPGGSWWLRPLAAATLAEGGDRQSSRSMWQRIHETADHAWLRDNARLRLLQFDALDQMDALGGLVRRYESVTGRAAQSWSDLVAVGWLRGVPADPAGTAYVLDRSQPELVTLSPTSPLYPLPPQFAKKASPPS